MNKTALEKLDEACDLLEKLDVSSHERNSNKILQEYFTTVTERIEEETQLVQELALQCDKNMEKEIYLEEKLKEKTNDISIDQQLIEEYKNIVLQETQKRDKLLKEIAAIDEEIEKENQSIQTDERLNSKSLKLAMYREMGISMQVDDDYQVKKAILTTPDGHDIRTIPLGNHNTINTTNTIWDFISKDLV